MLAYYEKEKLKEVFKKHDLNGAVNHIVNDDNSIKDIIILDALIDFILGLDDYNIRIAYKSIMKNPHNKEHVVLALADIYYQFK